MAVTIRNLELVRCFHDHGADPNFRAPPNFTADHGVSMITTGHHISVAVLQPLVIT